MDSELKTCPGAPMQQGARLLGIVNEHREVSLLSNDIEITDSFMNAAIKTGLPESRFRFAHHCVQAGCKQWKAGRCGVIDRVLEAVNDRDRKEDLPECSVRKTCRWFFQRGPDACRVCPYVITDNREF